MAIIWEEIGKQPKVISKSFNLSGGGANSLTENFTFDNYDGYDLSDIFMQTNIIQTNKSGSFNIDITKNLSSRTATVIFPPGITVARGIVYAIYI